MAERCTNRKRELLRQLKQVSMLKDILASLRESLPRTGIHVDERSITDTEALELMIRLHIEAENEKLRQGDMS